MRLLPVSFAFLALSIAPGAFAAGNVDSGRLVAQSWCASCHTVAPGTQGSDKAPPFDAIARKSNDTGWINAWLSNPHPPMQGINLSRQQIDDVVAYIQSLAPQK